MGAHLIDGQFQSDKYPTCPRGKVPLSVEDETAQDLLWEYAQRRRAVDAEFSADLETALRSAGFQGKDSVASDALRAAIADCFIPCDGMSTEFRIPSGDPIECVRAIGAELRRRNLHHHEHHVRETQLTQRVEAAEKAYAAQMNAGVELLKSHERLRDALRGLLQEITGRGLIENHGHRRPGSACRVCTLINAAEEALG